jgi:hypothetical protein
MINRKEVDSDREKDVKLAVWSKWLGIAGLIAVPAAFGLGFTFQQIGIVSLLRSVAIPLSMAAALTGFIVKNRVGESCVAARKNARLGFILGLVSLGAAVLIMMAVMLFFLPLLFLSQ